MQSRSIISLFITICFMLVSLFGYAAGSGKAMSDQFQNSPKMHSKNLFAQRLRRAVVKSGQLRRRRQDDRSLWVAQEQSLQSDGADSAPIYPASEYGQAQASPTYGQNPQQDPPAIVNFPGQGGDRGFSSDQGQGGYQGFASGQAQNLQAYAENFGNYPALRSGLDAYNVPQNPNNGYRRKK